MILRTYQPQDAASICQWIRTEQELYRWSADRFNRYPLSAADIEEHYQPQIQSGRFIPLTAADEQDIPLGHFIIRYPKDDDDSSIRFGFVILRPDSRGKGLGKEMLRLGIQYAKEQLHAARIDLGVFSNNFQARHCYEALGFKAYQLRTCEMPIGTWECIDMELFLT